MVQGSTPQIQALSREMADPSFHCSEQLQEFSSANIEKTVASFSSSCKCGKRPGLLLRGAFRSFHDLQLIPRDA